jgi:hypothetical protein
MKTIIRNHKRHEEGAILVYFILVAIAVIAIASVATYVAQTSTLAHRRSDMVAANQFALGGAVIACGDLNSALTNGSGAITAKLVTISNAYTLNGSLSTSSQRIYERTISSPFTNQMVLAQIWLPNVPSPTTAKVVTTATVGSVSQSATVNVKLSWANPAAIISVADGTLTDTGVSKSDAQDGNVVVNGDKNGAIVVDGGPGLAVLANGRLNMDTNYVRPPSSAYSVSNYNTMNEIPDFTTQGTSNTLFDIGRFIAVADRTPLGYSPLGNNHFTNLATFMTAVNAHTPTNPMLGVIAVDISTTDKNLGNLTDKNLPNGINIKGTMLFNFTGTGWDPITEKIIVTADVNINAADLSHLVVTNPATYTTGYPPSYSSDPTKNPINIPIGPTYQDFKAGDDLPAEIYTIGCLDMHGNANICGVLYTPSYMEIENKVAGNTQYFKGALIMGNGIYYENTTSGSTSIISFDPAAVDSLATLNGAGKAVRVAFWQ